MKPTHLPISSIEVDGDVTIIWIDPAFSLSALDRTGIIEALAGKDSPLPQTTSVKFPFNGIRDSVMIVRSDASPYTNDTWYLMVCETFGYKPQVPTDPTQPASSDQDGATNPPVAVDTPGEPSCPDATATAAPDDNSGCMASGNDCKNHYTPPTSKGMPEPTDPFAQTPTHTGDNTSPTTVIIIHSRDSVEALAEMVGQVVRSLPN